MRMCDVWAARATLIVLLAFPATGSIMTWENVPAVTRSQTMFGRTKEKFSEAKPYIEFKVTCEEDTSVSWILINADKSGIGIHNKTFKVREGTSCPNPSLNPDDCTLSTGSCEEAHYGQLVPVNNGGDNASDVNSYPDDGALGDNDDDDDDGQPGFPCNEELVSSTQNADGTEGSEQRYTYCCDTDVNNVDEASKTVKKFRGSNLLFSEEYLDRFIAGKTFHCQKGVTEEEGGITVIKQIPHDGHYTLYIQSNINLDNNEQVNLSGYVKFVSLSGFLSAAQYPLMVFYGTMGLCYLFLGLGWITAMALHFQDLLRLQFWLCGVIFLGMIEMAFAYGNLDWLNSHGTTSTFLFVVTQLLHAAKQTTARIMVLVVSMGYGVVKPKLGAAYKQVLGFGVAYMCFDSLYGITHIPPSDGPTESKYAMMAVVPISVLDAGVLWWIFFSLHRTMKILSLRQNTVKLQLYQRFRLLLAFFAVAAILFFGWTLYNSWDTQTNHAWENAWLLEAFGHILFTIVLIGILVLWRPSMNNSRYAYATLETDLLEDEDYQVVPNFGSETMTARTKSSRGMKPPEPVQRANVEDDLAWVEENIPAAVLSNDHTLASITMDSDEDIMETRLLMNKME